MNDRLDAMLEDLFPAPFEQEPSRRAAFIEQACGSDVRLRADLESLLSADDSAQGFMEGPALNLSGGSLKTQRGLEDSLIGRRIGSYELTRVIATGGMGTVYEAMQEEPRRRVALKVILVRT